MDNGAIVVAFLAAAGCGAVIGLERQAGKHEQSIVFGARTFALYGLWGALAGLLGDQFGGEAFAVALAGFVVLVALAYVTGARETGDRGTTTEAAAVAAFGCGVLAWLDMYTAALAVAVGTAALLRAKSPLHALTERFSEEDVRAVLQFAVITAVVLPLVPSQTFGPFGAFNPREIWLMVVFISAVGLAGYTAIRFLGSRGIALTGLLGGLVSSTAVTLGYSRMSRSAPLASPAITAGILGACALMYPRVLLEAAVIAPSMAAILAAPLLGVGAAVFGFGLIMWRRGSRVSDDSPKLRLVNPLTLGVALQFGALYAVVVFASRALTEWLSESSIQFVGAVSGINDVDAITLSTANLVRQGLDPTLAAKTVILAVSVNAIAKVGIALALGNRHIRWGVSAGLLPAAVVGLVIWALL